MTIKCPGCGAALVYDAVSGKMLCTHCVTYYGEQEIGTYTQEKDKFDNIQEDSDGNGESEKNRADEDEFECEIYKCTNCGAELAINDTESSTFCAYCGQPTIVMSRIVRQKKPQGIIPFEITKQQALQILRNKLNKGFFVPKEVKDVQIDKVHGIYIPYKVYNIDYEDEMVLSGVVGTGKSARIKHYYRHAKVNFENITMDASVMLDDESSIRLEPYNFFKCVPFSQIYMSGFYSNIKDDDEDRLKEGALVRASNMFDEQVKKTVHADEVKVQKHNPCVNINAERYVMLPAWFVSFRHNGVNNTIMVNGQTGKCVGAVEEDKKKKSIFFWTVAAVLIPVFYIIINLVVKYFSSEGQDVDAFKLLGLGLVLIFATAFGISSKFEDSRKLTKADTMKRFANDRQEGDE